MTEEQINEKKQLLMFVGRFVGKQLQKEGTSPKGKEWKKFKLSFTTDDGKTKSFSAFAPLPEKSKQLKELEEGNMYKVMYSESKFQIPGGDLITLKNVALIYDINNVPQVERKPISQQQSLNQNAIAGDPYRLTPLKQNITKEENEIYAMFKIDNPNSTKKEFVMHYLSKCDGTDMIGDTKRAEEIWMVLEK